ncbi:uncharacterized protein LOC124688660 [Lolium rigidum]|uniref:uncharacterized protein LOC124688660 n=1 Tax=Lolium rigidum TaxID=89674 RepID=UPI001F5D411A|nr:uncharacterized protein LOC124688660 [Lolium rigidum]
MSGSLLLRSAGRVVRRSFSQAQDSFHRSPVRLLSGGAGRFQPPNEHSPSKPKVGHNERLESGRRICRAAEYHKDLDEFASEVRVVRDKVRAWEQRCKESDKWHERREGVLICATVLFIAFCVFS